MSAFPAPWGFIIQFWNKSPNAFTVECESFHVQIGQHLLLVPALCTIYLLDLLCIWLHRVPHWTTFHCQHPSVSMRWVLKKVDHFFQVGN